MIAGFRGLPGAAGYVPPVHLPGEPGKTRCRKTITDRWTQVLVEPGSPQICRLCA